MKKFVRLNRSGFTLIEVIVVAAIIAILAGILVPMIYNQVDESKVSKAQGDCKSIQTAISMFNKDMSLFPYRSNGSIDVALDTNVYTLLVSDGTELLDANLKPGWIAAKTKKDLIKNHLTVNDNNYIATRWKGPYLADAKGDPWGNTYYVGAQNFINADPAAPKPVWIISAGPDGILQTDIDDTVLAGDDIGIRYK